MSIAVTIKDETASGATYNEMPLEFPFERITIRDLIRERVYQEVQDYNRKQDQQVFCGLVQPTDSERVLNGNRTEFRLNKHRNIQWKSQFEKAVEAFDHNGFLILIDEKQAEDVDQEFEIGHESKISFVKLTPLVGG
ncbi:MAG: hypothetical protein ACJ8FY_16655 [Gemmataceae bacterium]